MRRLVLIALLTATWLPQAMPDDINDSPELLRAEQIFKLTRTQLDALDSQIGSIEQGLTEFAANRKSMNGDEIVRRTTEQFNTIDSWLVKAYAFLKDRQPADVTAFEDLIGQIDVATAGMSPDSRHYQEYMQKRAELAKYVDEVKAKYGNLKIEILSMRKLLDSKGRQIGRKLTMLLLDKDLKGLDEVIEEIGRLRKTIRERFGWVSGDAT